MSSPAMIGDIILLRRCVMRFLSLLVLLVALPAYAELPKPAADQKASTSAYPNSWSILGAPSVGAASLDASSIRNPEAGPDLGKYELNWVPTQRLQRGTRVNPEQAYCYKLRTYRVKRDERDSDLVHIAGYTTCQPSSLYTLRTSDITVRDDREGDREGDR